MLSFRTAAYKLAYETFRAVGTRFVSRRSPAANQPAIDVLGFHGEVLGIAETARQFVEALARKHPDTRALDLGPDLRVSDAVGLDANNPDRILISHVNPPELLALFRKKASASLRSMPHIGYWVWELASAPAGWKGAERLVDAIWTPSEFSASALRKLTAGAVEVSVLPPPLFAASPVPARSRRGDTDVVRLLAVCDLRSSAARKNPFGAIDAFNAMPASARSKSRLTVKVTGAEAAPDQFQKLRDRLSGCVEIELLAENLTDAQMMALIYACDIAISLHRAEGFGLLPAHAALAGRPVLATNWSAPTEYLDERSSALVPYELVPVEDSQGVYSGDQIWAEPDIDAAASMLADLVENRDARSQLGLRAQESAAAHFGPERWFARFEDLIRSTYSI